MALTQVSTGGVKDGTILNADLNASAAIAGTKINPSFTSNISINNSFPSLFLTDTEHNSDFSIQNQDGTFGVKDETNSVTRFSIDSSGNVGIGGTSNVGTKLHIENASGDAHIRLRGSANYGVLFTRHSDAALTGYVGSGNAVNLGTSNVALSAPLSGGDIIFQTNGTAATDEKMRINSNGAIRFTSENATGWQLDAGDDSASYSAIDNHFPTTNRTLYMNNETTHRSVAFWNKNGSDGYGFGLDNSGNFKVVSGTVERVKMGADGVTSILNSTPPATGTGVLFVSDDGSATTLGTAATCRIANDGGNAAYSVFEAESGSGSIRLANDGRFITTGNVELGGVLTIQDNNSIFFGSSQDIEMRHNATSSQNQLISKNHNFLLLSNSSINFQIYASGNTNNQAILTLQNTAITASRDIRVDRGSTIDGIVGQAYSGYFGLKHTDQTLNSEYMIINNNSNTYISCTSGYSIYLRPSANSTAHETVFAHDNTTYKTNIVMDSHPIRRNQHQWGHLEGSYNNVEPNAHKSNPIYTIGSSYNPNEGDLNNMYGIGFSHGNASFTPSGAGWGMYVAADGDSRIYLDGSSGNIHLSASSSNGGAIFFANGGWTGDATNGKIQTYAGHMYLQNAGTTSKWFFRSNNGSTAAEIASNGTYTTSDVTFKKDVITISNSVDTIKKLTGRSFTWKEDDKKSFGVIAQEVETVLPELVTTTEEPEGSEVEPKKMVNYAAFAGHFIEAIKELATKVEALETEVAALKAS